MIAFYNDWLVVLQSKCADINLAFRYANPIARPFIQGEPNKGVETIIDGTFDLNQVSTDLLRLFVRR
jgi:hypothetical protein